MAQTKPKIEVTDITITEEAGGAEYAEVITQVTTESPEDAGLVEKHEQTYRAPKLRNGYYKIPEQAPQEVQEKVHTLNSQVFYDRRGG